MYFACYGGVAAVSTTMNMMSRRTARPRGFFADVPARGLKRARPREAPPRYFWYGSSTFPISAWARRIPSSAVYFSSSTSWK